jgi:hypothetical protein
MIKMMRSSSELLPPLYAHLMYARITASPSRSLITTLNDDIADIGRLKLGDLKATLIEVPSHFKPVLFQEPNGWLGLLNEGYNQRIQRTGRAARRRLELVRVDNGGARRCGQAVPVR